MKKVNASYYNEKYYFEDCGGFKEFKKSYGQDLDRRNKRLVKEMPSVKNKKVLDVGCGRGELVFWAARNGADLAIGTDYSSSAIKIANTAKAKYPRKIRDKVELKKMDATDLKFDDKSFDVVIYTDVHEHLYPKVAEKALSELNRVLKENGVLFLHTEPNRLFYNVAWRFWCYPASSLLIWLNKLISKSRYPNIPKPKEVRNKVAKRLHVNETSYFDLRKLFRKFKFSGQIQTTNIIWIKPLISWKDLVYNFLVYLDPISRFFPFNILFGQDFLAVLTKK